MQTVVVTGSRVVQVLAPVPLADDSAGVLYLRLVRARANLASALREVESVTGGRARRSTGQPGVGALPSAAGTSARRTAVPSALPGPASGTSTPPRGVPAAARTGGSSASPSATRPGAATPSPLAPPLATPLPTTPLPTTPSAPPAPPPSTPAALPSAALLPAPRPAAPTPGPASAQLERRAEGAVATDPSPAAVSSTPTAFAPEPRAPAHEPEEPQARSRSSYLAAEFFAAAHRARPPLPPDPAPRPAPRAGQPRQSRGADAGAAQRRGERDPRPGPPTERLSAAPGTAGPRHRVPGPRPAPDDPAGATVPGAAPQRAARASSAPSHPSSADERTAGPADDERSPAGPDATVADRPVDPHEHAADGTRSDPSDDTATAPPDALPRRRGDTVIPPPREPEDADQERRWATDLHTLRRLADGLRRRLR
ncbi:hypothetical protein [Pseudonocardia halophobica]|uniref:hypothetical protein n=1 Tax=Pseudonocardia halophobica TaxID=29401 RepID=UPI0005682DF1|nr:hypothetical protein [Pseudonocardia halophobica]